MSQRFRMDRQSFEQFLAAFSLLQELQKSPAQQSSRHLLVHLLQLQQGIDAGRVGWQDAINRAVSLIPGILGATSAAVFSFRAGDEFTCCARAGSAFDEERLGLEVLAQLADPASSAEFERDTLPQIARPVKTSHYPGSPKSLLVAPIRFGGKVTAALAAFSVEFDAFTQRDADNLRFLAGLLEQAFVKAVRAGCEQALALEHVAIAQLAERLSPRLEELAKQAAADSEPRAADDTAHEVINKQILALVNRTSASTTTSDIPARTVDTSIPGIGVRAALGDVREFTGETEPSRIASAIARGRVCAQQWLKSCQALLSRAGTGIASSIHAPVPRPRLRSSGVAHLRPFPRTRSGAAKAANRAKMKIAALWRYRPQWPNRPRVHVPRIQWTSLKNPLRSAVSMFSALTSALSTGVTAVLSHHEDVHHAWTRARRGLRQNESNVSSAAHDARLHLRVVWRRQRRWLTSGSTQAGKILQHAGQSLGTAVVSAASQISSIPAPSVDRRALRKSVGAMAVLFVMIGFLILNTLGRSPFHAETASAKTSTPSSAPAPTVTSASSSQPGPSSHLKLTDSAITDSLHELTRYEVATLHRAADYGDDDAAFQLGMAYETGYYVRQSCTKAANWVQKAATAGNPAAEYNLGLRYRTGDGVPMDQLQAERWLHRAAMHHYPAAGQPALSAHQATESGNPGQL